MPVGAAGGYDACLRPLALRIIVSLTGVIATHFGPIHSAVAALPTQAQLVFPSYDKATSDWNEQGCGTSASHKGYDFNRGSGDQDLGDPIFASYAGIVVAKETGSSGYGNHLIIRHQTSSTTKYETLYAHLQGFASGINVNTSVRIGQHIATKGSQAFLRLIYIPSFDRSSTILDRR